jgi:hypothetical protein
MDVQDINKSAAPAAYGFNQRIRASQNTGREPCPQWATRENEFGFLTRGKRVVSRAQWRPERNRPADDEIGRACYAVLIELG